MQSTQEGKPRIDVNNTHHSELVESFLKALQEDALPNEPGRDATETWECLRDVIYDTTLSTFGKRQGKTQDWFEDNSDVMLPAIEEKRNALIAYKKSSNDTDIPTRLIMNEKKTNTLTS